MKKYMHAFPVNRWVAILIFAVLISMAVCAAKGCPTLRSEAYTAEKLDAQLDDQSRRFLASPAGLRIDRAGKVVYFSSIFKWYGEDFVAGFLPSSGYSGLDNTERAVANFCTAIFPHQTAIT